MENIDLHRITVVKSLIGRYGINPITVNQEKSRRSLLRFTQYTFPTYKVDRFHSFICRVLDEVLEGKRKRVLISAPPQHGKSELCSIRFPSYWVGRRPNDPIILCSYAAALAHTMSRHARNTVEDVMFKDLFPHVRTDPQSRSVQNWDIKDYHRGGMVSAGVGGPITGHGASLGIIDDPVENWDQAQSELIRDKTWDWYKGTFRTRIWKEGSIVLIQTRWHEDDLTGRLLQEGTGDWDVIRIPAIAESQEERDSNNDNLGLPEGLPDPIGREEGEALCPSLFPIEALLDIKNDVGPMGWSALYQGSPTSPEGNRFKREWFPIVDSIPENVRRGRYWDLASTVDGKRTAGVLLAIDREGTVYIEDVVFGKWTTDNRNLTMRQTAAEDHVKYGNRGTMWFEEEPGSSGKDAASAIIKYMSGYAVQADRATGNKDIRLEPFAAQAGAGNVRVLRGSWNRSYISEMCSIPAGKYRDMADATAGAFNKLASTAVKIARLTQRRKMPRSRMGMRRY